MLFRGLRAGDEVILASPAGRGAGASFTFAPAEVEQVKSTTAVVAGYKFNLKDGRGRTVPHYILPATPANLAKLTPSIPAGFKQVFPKPYVPPKQIQVEPSKNVTTLSPTSVPVASPSSR